MTRNNLISALLLLTGLHAQYCSTQVNILLEFSEKKLFYKIIYRHICADIQLMWNLTVHIL